MPDTSDVAGHGCRARALRWSRLMDGHHARLPATHQTSVTMAVPATATAARRVELPRVACCQASLEPSDCPDSTDQRDWNEPIDSNDIADPSDPIEANDPAEPIDRTDPADATDNTDSHEPTLRTELRDPIDSTDGMPPSCTPRTGRYPYGHL